MEERLRIENLISEREMSKSLGISKQSLLKLRSSGAPWIAIGGRVFYHGQLFMAWLLKNRLRQAEEGLETGDN
jgi:hypothetical protein